MFEIMFFFVSDKLSSLSNVCNVSQYMDKLNTKLHDD